MSERQQSSPAASPGSVWVVSVGDELLAGDIVNTNLAFIAQRCRAVGLTVLRALTVRDRVEEIAAAVTDAARHGAGACLVSGGLGPTTDDLTAEGIAAAAGVALQRDETALQRLRAKFEAFGVRDMPPANAKQADFPAGAEVLDNPIGSAEGFVVAIEGCRVFAMPGVPRELRKMTEEQVLPRLSEAWSLCAVPRRVYHVLGHGESSVAQRIAGVIERARTRSPGLAAMFVHYRASMPRVTVLVEGTPGDDGVGATQDELATLDEEMVEALSPGLYGIGEADLATRIVDAATAAGVTIAVAESCTAGGTGALLATVSGASACFLGGVIAYDNRVKIGLLGVPEAELAEHGAVSEPVARSMAAGGRRATGADLCVAITGIAGPTGGSAEKPVGTVDLAVCDGNETTHKRLKLRGDRGTVQRAAAQWALKLLWDRLVQRGEARITPLPS